LADRDATFSSKFFENFPPNLPLVPEEDLSVHVSARRSAPKPNRISSSATAAVRRLTRQSDTYSRRSSSRSQSDGALLPLWPSYRSHRIPVFWSACASADDLGRGRSVLCPFGIPDFG